MIKVNGGNVLIADLIAAHSERQLCGTKRNFAPTTKLLTSSPNNVLISKKAPKQYAAIGKKYLQLSRLDNAFSDGFNEPFNSLGVTRLSKCQI